MDRDRRRLLRTALLLSGVLGLAVGTFLVLDLLGLTGDDRFLGYLLVTTVITGGTIFYTAYVVTEYQRQSGVERRPDTGDENIGSEE